jgi:hypothetical protein
VFQQQPPHYPEDGFTEREIPRRAQGGEQVRWEGPCRSCYRCCRIRDYIPAGESTITTEMWNNMCSVRLAASTGRHARVTPCWWT